jgi:hypothetical protein
MDDEAKRELQHKKDMDMVIAAMDRAVSWVKENKDHLRFFHVSFWPCKSTGVQIDLGFRPENCRESIKALFSGKKATKTLDDDWTREQYTLVDEEKNLKFTWSIWTGKSKPKEELKEEVTF